MVQVAIRSDLGIVKYFKVCVRDDFGAKAQVKVSLLNFKPFVSVQIRICKVDSGGRIEDHLTYNKNMYLTYFQYTSFPEYGVWNLLRSSTQTPTLHVCRRSYARDKKLIFVQDQEQYVVNASNEKIAVVSAFVNIFSIPYQDLIENFVNIECPLKLHRMSLPQRFCTTQILASNLSASTFIPSTNYSYKPTDVFIRPVGENRRAIKLAQPFGSTPSKMTIYKATNDYAECTTSKMRRSNLDLVPPSPFGMQQQQQPANNTTMDVEPIPDDFTTSLGNLNLTPDQLQLVYQNKLTPEQLNQMMAERRNQEELERFAATQAVQAAAVQAAATQAQIDAATQAAAAAERQLQQQLSIAQEGRRQKLNEYNLRRSLESSNANDYNSLESNVKVTYTPDKVSYMVPAINYTDINDTLAEVPSYIQVLQVLYKYLIRHENDVLKVTDRTIENSEKPYLNKLLIQRPTPIVSEYAGEAEYYRADPSTTRLNQFNETYSAAIEDIMGAATNIEFLERASKYNDVFLLLFGVFSIVKNKLPMHDKMCRYQLLMASCYLGRIDWYLSSMILAGTYIFSKMQENPEACLSVRHLMGFLVFDEDFDVLDSVMKAAMNPSDKTYLVDLIERDVYVFRDENAKITGNKAYITSFSFMTNRFNLSLDLDIIITPDNLYFSSTNALTLEAQSLEENTTENLGNSPQRFVQSDKKALYLALK